MAVHITRLASKVLHTSAVKSWLSAVIEFSSLTTVSMTGYTIQEMADVHLICGAMDENASEAQRLYGE